MRERKSHLVSALLSCTHDPNYSPACIPSGGEDRQRDRDRPIADLGTRNATPSRVLAIIQQQAGEN